MSKQQFNFDDAMRLRTQAASKGIGSKDWVDFAHMMFDEFPALYETARRMTVHQDELATERNTLKQQRDELLAALKAVKATLERENDGLSPICDTIWHGPAETLFDFIDEAIAKASA